MLPTISLFSLSVPLYTVCAITGILLCMILAAARCKKVGADLTDILLSLTFGLFFCILGAWLFYYIFSYGLDNVFREIGNGDWSFIRKGGLVFYGGLICGVSGAFLTRLVTGDAMAPVIDVLIPLVPLGHAFGRLGCLFAGCCWGMEYSGFLAVTTVYAAGTHLPVQLFEALGEVILCIYLHRLQKRSSGHYEVLFAFFSIYACMRFLLEFLRDDAIRGIFGLFSTSQWISLLLLLLCCGLSAWNQRRSNRATRKALFLQQKYIWMPACIIFWACVWLLIARSVGSTLLLPGPGETLRAFFIQAGQLAFWKSTGYTLLRILSGFSAALLIGTLLALLCHFSCAAQMLLSPVRTIIRATPVASFIVLLWLWLSKGMVPAFISFLMVIPIVWTNVQEGLDDPDPLLLEMAHAYHFTPLQTLRQIYLPALRTHFSAACATGLGFAWKSGISAQVIARPLHAIGTGIADAKVYLETEELFAWTLTVILFSLLLEKLLRMMLQRGGKADGLHQ